MKAWWWALLLLGVQILSGCSGCPARRGPDPLSPEEALQTFRIHEDFRIELFAAEPEVADPVELVFDEQGRIFVAEMADYPYDPEPGQPPKSRIRLIEDTDGDGRIDRSTLFADQLLNATSVLPWKGGLIVTSAPDILYLKDTDGDNKADVRQVLFTGFAVKVDSESRITNLRFNIDNWIYASNNGRPGNITFTERPDVSPLSVLGVDFRFRLDRRLFEAASGPTQFGQAVDDWGHRFITQNTVHVRHVVMPRRYFGRNPFLTLGGASRDVSDHGRPSVRIFPLTEPQYWRQVRTQMRQQRYREHGLDSVRELNPSTEIVGGYFTAAAGGTIYSADLFPEEYRGNLFTGDVSANLIHRDVLRAEGASFVASRGEGEQDREFLRSTDPWFRPCNFVTGPDGYLYVVDLYREFVETPASIPDELKQEMDFYSGGDRGRIYRIVPRENQAADPSSRNLGQAETSELVRLLSHPNAWWRFTAQRLLLEGQDESAVPALRQVVLMSDFAQARLHALYALEGLDSLELSLVEAALQDSHPGVREHGVILAERFRGLADRLVSMVDDPSPRVQFQLALSLGEFVNAGAARRLASTSLNSPLGALAALASQHSEDPWFRKAVLSSVPESSLDLLETLSQRGDFFREGGSGAAEFLEELSAVVGARNRPRELARWIALMSRSRRLSREQWQTAGLAGLGRGLELARAYQLKVPGGERYLREVLASPSEELQAAGRDVARHFEMQALVSASMRQALDPSVSPRERQLAILSLASGSFDRVRPVLEKLLDSDLDAALAGAVIETAATFNHSEVSELLISKWSRFGPEIRGRLLDALSSRRRRVPDLLQAVEDGRIERIAIGLPRREKLLHNPDQDIRDRAARLFEAESGNPEAVMKRYESAVVLDGNADQGRALFEQNCASCHLAKGGRRVGPSLSGVSAQSTSELLRAILNPSVAIEARYTNYIVLTEDGRIHDGLIVSETPGTLTLRNGEAQDETILRSDISEIRASSVSLMPDGLEEGMTPQNLADLIAFLQGTDLHQH